MDLEVMVIACDEVKVSGAYVGTGYGVFVVEKVSCAWVVKNVSAVVM